MIPKTLPPNGTRASDLTDAEFAELDDLLLATPEPLEPLDVVMLDGYLCGVLVQPLLLEPATWLNHVFDFDGAPLPESVDPVWQQRVTALIMRRHAALNRALEEDGAFDPLILEPDDDPAAQPPDEAGDDPLAGLAEISRPLMPWVAGFQHATETFPDLVERPDDAVMAALARLYRHLPADSGPEQDIVATLDREHPLHTLDEAIEDLVACVADLHDLTRDDRYKVDTVKRDAPKVGRNEPCPCGSGKKFKLCHGAA